MLEGDPIAINTSPLIARVAAWSDLTRLEGLYGEIWVLLEVGQEILQGRDCLSDWDWDNYVSD